MTKTSEAVTNNDRCRQGSIFSRIRSEIGTAGPAPARAPPHRAAPAKNRAKLPQNCTKSPKKSSGIRHIRAFPQNRRTGSATRYKPKSSPDVDWY